MRVHFGDRPFEDRSGILAEPAGVPHLAHISEHAIFHSLVDAGPAKLVEQWYAEGRANAIGKINEALRQNPNYIRYLYVDKLSDKISVIVSDQNTIMDLKGILENKPK